MIIKFILSSRTTILILIRSMAVFKLFAQLEIECITEVLLEDKTADVRNDRERGGSGKGYEGIAAFSDNLFLLRVLLCL